MNRYDTIKRLLQQRILILDGAMGTMIQRYATDESDFRGNRFQQHDINLKGCNDILCITAPHIITRIHNEYLTAGADIIETNTFNANAISLADYDLQQYVTEINLQAATLARQAADEFNRLTPDKPRFVAGSVGPTNKMCSMSPHVDNPAFRDITFDTLVAAYTEQITALIQGGIDLLLIETIFDTLNAKAAIYAAEAAMQATDCTLPIMLSITLTESGRLLSGQTIEAFLTSVAHAPLLSVGLNCSFGAADMLHHLQLLARQAPYFISAYPNAGLPNIAGGYDETLQQMIATMQPYFTQQLVNIVGGCCGTTPQYTALLAECATQYTPHSPTATNAAFRLSGLDNFIFTPESNFINIGERCNVAGSRKFLRLIKEKKYTEALDIARSQVDAGAQILDINMDDAMLDARTEMETFLRLIASEPDICRIPIMIDSSKWDVITTGLKTLQGKCIVNSISLKEGENIFLSHAREIKRLGAAVVVMAFDEQGQADTLQRRIDVCARAYNLLTQVVHFNPNDIIFDPNILAIATGIDAHRNYAVDFIEATRWIRKNLPGVHVSGGISNLSFALRGNNYIREAMHAVMLYHAIAAGMDMGILNPASSVTYNELPPHIMQAVEDVILNRHDNATEQLIRLAEQLTEQPDIATAQHTETPNISPTQQLTKSIIQGRTDKLELSLQALLDNGFSALDIIDGALMDGINSVGERFAAGQMFLPQVVKSARTMKQAVSYLQPYIERDKKNSGNTSNGTFILATVKGDVHDIGKNIVAVILACNNFKVIDLGVMVSAETIVQCAIKEKADFVGLSGLITPSLDEMCHVADRMQQAGLDIPLFIGGATTSAQHTAIHIAPRYQAPVIYTRDAAQNPIIALQLLKPQSRQAFIATLQQEQKTIRNSFSASQLIPYDRALLNRCVFDWNNYHPVTPTRLGVFDYDISIEQARKFINWRSFLAVWQLDASMVQIADIAGCDHCKAQWLAAQPQQQRAQAAQAMQLYKEATRMLDTLQRDCNNSIIARYGIFKAGSTLDSIIIEHNGTEHIIPCLRQQQLKPSPDAPYYALNDFIKPSLNGRPSDFITLFAVSAGHEIANRIAAYQTHNDSYHTLLLQSLADRLVEAATEWLHYKIRTELWAYTPNETIDKLTASKPYIGIRPAIGYPSLPDQSLIFLLDKLIGIQDAGIYITPNGAMRPAASIAGMMIAHPTARYFAINHIDDTQYNRYCNARQFTSQQAHKWLGTLYNDTK